MKIRFNKTNTKKTLLIGLPFILLGCWFLHAIGMHYIVVMCFATFASIKVSNLWPLYTLLRRIK